MGTTTSPPSIQSRIPRGTASPSLAVSDISATVGSLTAVELPDQLWVPAHPGTPRADGEPRIRIELRQRGGQSVGVAFGSIAELVAQLGPAQPWMLMRFLAVLGAHEILLDPDLSASPGRWDWSDVERFAGRDGRG